MDNEATGLDKPWTGRRIINVLNLRILVKKKEKAVFLRQPFLFLAALATTT